MGRISIPIVRRRVKISFDGAQPRGWHGRREDIETFLNAISFFFPPGERFFVRSIQHYVDRIKDPVLKDEARRFIYQEAMHTKEHQRCNETLGDAFPDGPALERMAGAVLGWNQRWAPKFWQLAMTCALEHFTALLADGLLEHQDTFFAESDPAYTSLWLWHAVEETEHKGVCFDVYQEQMGKGPWAYVVRTVSMLCVSAGFLVAVAVAVRRFGKRAAADEGAAGGKRLSFVALLKESISMPLYLDYFRYGFHPWDHNNVALVDKWKARYRSFGTDVDAAPARASSDLTGSPVG